jgi:hypothetical protein
MFGKVSNYLHQTVRYLRTFRLKSANHRRSRNLISLSTKDFNQSIESIKSNDSTESFQSFKSAKSTSSNTSIKSDKLLDQNVLSLNQIESINLNNEKMPKRQLSKFDELCKDFEVRLENSVKVINSKVTITNVNETIVIDDDVEEQFNNLINQKRKRLKKDDVKDDVKDEVIVQQTTIKTTESTTKFRNLTSELQNVQVNQIKHETNKTFLNNEMKDITRTITNVDLNIQQKEVTVKTDDLKQLYKNLKPENYRIQQVIKEQDLVYFDVGEY